MHDSSNARANTGSAAACKASCPLCGRHRAAAAIETEHVRILLVEDDPDDVWIVRNLLGDRWDGPFDLIHVETLQQALERCAAQDFAVILLDLSLPDSRGLETFERIHAAAFDVPVVVLTGLNDENLAITAVQTGAEDYLVKGQVTDNLLVRSIRYAIERSRRYRIERQLEATSEEFRAAREVQQRLFPARSPEIDGLDIAGALWPATATAGDYFDYIPMSQGRLGVVVGDVSSHGMGPALLMAQTRACLRTLVDVYDDVGKILTHANRVLAADCGDAHFVTIFFAQFDPAQRQAVYASAGQRGYLLDADGKATVLDSTCIPLGIEPTMCVPCAAPLRLQRDQIFVLFTDGVFEAESPERVPFGTARALAEIQAQRHRPSREIIAHLYDMLNRFTRAENHVDDITIVLAKVTG